MRYIIVINEGTEEFDATSDRKVAMALVEDAKNLGYDDARIITAP